MYNSFQYLSQAYTTENFDYSIISHDSSILLSEITVTGPKGRVFHEQDDGKAGTSGVDHAEIRLLM